jgi:cytochrome P450/nitrite reductase/ring-hydroxylating ferredoxin subunit
MSQTVVASPLVAVAALSELPPGEPHGLTVDDVHLVALRVEEQVRLYEGRCAHQGTLLSEGSLEGNHLVCRAHGWRYDVATGAAVDHPPACLQSFSATVMDGQVWVSRDELAEWRQRSVTPVSGTATAGTPRTLRRLADLPGPKRLPLLGNLHQVQVATIHQQLEQWCAEYGPLFRYQLGPRTFLAVGDPELIADALRERPGQYRRFSVVEPLFKEIGVHGVFSAEKEEWRRYRKLAMEALSNRHLRQFFPTLHMVLGRLKGRWDKTAAKGQALDIQKEFMRYTVDVTTTLAFGIDMNTVEDEGRALQRHMEKIFPMIARRLIFPFAYWRYFKLGPDRELDHALIELDRIVSDLVAQARRRMADRPELFQRPSNFLEAMLAVQAQDEEHFTDAEIVGNVYTMLGAGEDTTANTLAWMLHLLCQHPEVVAKLRAEIDGVLGDCPLLVDFRDAEALVYVDAVTQETMRLRPVAPIISILETNEEVVLGDVRLDRGTPVTLIARAATLDAQHFADPQVFRPERWLEDAPLSPHHANVAMPFGSGPRMCPGRSLALLEIKAALAMIVRNFDMQHASGVEQVTEQFAFTMMPRNLLIRFKRRKTV